MSPTAKATEWIGPSKKDLKAMPAEVQDEIGYALHIAQEGNRAANAKPLKGFSGISVMEITADFATDTYRGVYTVKFARAIYVLHCFQKKSKRGIEMTQSDKDLIRQRLQAAEADYHKKYERQEDV